MFKCVLFNEMIVEVRKSDDNKNKKHMQGCLQWAAAFKVQAREKTGVAARSRMALWLAPPTSQHHHPITRAAPFPPPPINNPPITHNTSPPMCAPYR